MRKTAITATVVGGVAAIAATGAIATPPSGLKSQLLARGEAGRFNIHDKSMHFKLDAKRPTQVALVRATLDPHGSTGWHGHPGPSMVIVATGTLTMLEAGDDGGCSVHAFRAGSAFGHPEHVHNFVNRTDAVVEFYVAYFVPERTGALLNDVDPAPAGSSACDAAVPTGGT